jgi:hypothetical protein
MRCHITSAKFYISAGPRNSGMKESLRLHSLLRNTTVTKPEFDKIHDELNLTCLRNADVIGVATTRQARNLNMLR